MARELGVSRQAVSQYADGTTQPNVDKLRIIAEHFGVSADYLIGLSDFKQLETEGITAQELGLNEDAIVSLQNGIPDDEPHSSRPEFRLFALNRLLQEPDFYYVLDKLSHFILADAVNEADFSMCPSPEIKEEAQKARFEKFVMTDALNQLLDKLVPPLPWNEWIQEAIQREDKDPSIIQNYIKSLMDDRYGSEKGGKKWLTFRSAGTKAGG